MFMWEWQHVFRAITSILVEDILKLLQVNMAPNVFVMGVLARNGETVFFEPEASGFRPDDFATLGALAKEKYENDPGRNLMISAAHLHEAHQASLWPKAIQEAVEQILGEHDVTRKTISFCSFPVRMNEHWVLTIIQLDQQEYDHHYRLTTASHQVNPMRRIRLARSFLEATVRQLLTEAQRELQAPTRGNSPRLADPERVLEDAASILLASVRWRVNEMGGDFVEIGNAIAAERYEGSGSRGRLVLARQDHPDVLIQLRLKEPVRIGNFRGIRKLLEVSSHEMALLCDGERVWGLGSPQPTYSPTQEDLFELRFTDHYTWELIHAENVMLRVRYRQARLPRERFDEALFRDHVERLFGAEEATMDQLIEAVKAAVEQRHGTMLVITPAAESEAERLGAQSTPIAAQPVTSDIIMHVSSIDGAMLIAPNGTFHAFGVILDGLASSRGVSSRGARYNSAIRYVDGQRERGIPCLALIVSEDGYVDLDPQLKPRISRQLIDNLLNTLEHHAGAPEMFDSDEAWSALSHLSRLRFYLLEEDVERANAAKEVVVERLHAHRRAEAARAGLGYVIPQFNDFVVDSEMSREYYLHTD